MPAGTEDDPVAGEAARGGDPPVPALLKAVWAVFALWAAYYALAYLVPEFRLWKAGS
jgi:hypothetical protein